MTGTDSRTETLRIVFVCTGNICRSAMADVIARDALEHEGLLSDVRVDSCGTGGWHIGQGADDRAIEELRRHGLDGTYHRAQQFGPEFEDANLFIVMDQGHAQSLKKEGIDSHRIRFMRSFDPNSDSDVPLEDPYYGDQSDFSVAYNQIEASLPGLMKWIKKELADRSDR